MSEQVGSVTRKKSSDFHGGIRFQSSFTIRWELEDKNFLKIDIIDSLKYRIMAIKTNENFIPFSNSVTFRKPRGTDLVTASELIPGFCRSNVPTPGSLRAIKSPTAGIVPGIKSPPLACTAPPLGIYIHRCIIFCTYKLFVHWELKLLSFLVDSFLNIPFVRYKAQILRQYFDYCEYFFCLFVFSPFIQQAWSVICKSRWILIYNVKKLCCRKQQND